MWDRIRRRLYVIIFEHDSWAGKAFDVALLWCILISVLTVMLETVVSIRKEYGAALRFIEWSLTILFTLEYVLRLIAVPRPWRYAVSFFGIVDVLAVIPTYLSVLFPGAQSLVVIRGLRLLRVFRVLKLGQYVGEANQLARALKSSQRKITVFLATVVIVVIIIGALMYLIEGPDSGFTSIPTAVYWAIVTMTTVGYGDIAPQTVPGQMLASALMIFGYGIIAVPTGIVTAEIAQGSMKEGRSTSRGDEGSGAGRPCSGCGAAGHDRDARHCKYCGTRLDEGLTAS